MENEEIYEEYSDQVQEVNEELSEQIIVDDSGPNNSDIVVDDTFLNENQVNDSLEELLKEYIKTTLSENDDGVDDSEIDEENTADPESEIIEQIDYTELLKDISYKSDVLNDTQEQIYLRSIEIDENNTMLSALEDISLTNQLLLFIFIAILFTGVIEFTRRLF